MATSKVGGTSGKLKGQVGDTIYQVKKNSDGTYTQYVYQKGERTEETITPRLQAQRMITAIVESIMRDLKEVWRLSWQDAKTKVASLNEMSSYNLRLVQNDAKMHWYGNNLFIYPHRLRTDKQIKDLGGVFRISQGTLLKNLFDSEIYDDFPARRWSGVRSFSDQLYGVVFSANFGRETVAEWMRRHGITYSDNVCFCGFHDWYKWNEGDEESVEYWKNEYFIVSFDMSVPQGAIMTPQILDQLMKIKSSLAPRFIIGKNNAEFAIGWIAQVDEKDETFFYVASFSISFAGGRKKVKTSSYHNPEGGSEPWWMNQCPANVLGSWMGEPQVIPYPYPW